MKTNWKDQLPLLCALTLLSLLVLANTVVRYYRYGPEIVVYLDRGAKQPAILPLPAQTIVAGERAAFWWTVFNKAAEKNSIGDARYVATGALESVYGPAK